MRLFLLLTLICPYAGSLVGATQNADLPPAGNPNAPPEFCLSLGQRTDGPALCPILTYTQETIWNVPCDGHPIGTERTVRVLERGITASGQDAGSFQVTAASPNADPAQTADLLVGWWGNENLNTPGLTQVNVRRDGARILAHAWGRCALIDCDWGEEAVELRKGIGLVVWEHGFSTTQMQLMPQPDGKLRVAYRSEYHDNSGRVDKGQTESFTRQAPQEDDASAAAARAVLRQVSEQYRTLPTYSESISTGRVTRTRTYYLPPDKMREEIDDLLEPFVRVADGKLLWTIYTAANEYRVFPQGKNQGTPTSLDPIRGTPHITGHEVCDGVACTVIQVKMERGAIQTYWIEDERHVVRKSTMDAREASHSEVVYPVVRLGGAVKAELFTYDPEATHAKDRSVLSREAPLTSVGKLAGDFTLPDLDGREVTLSNLRGKVVLLDFWGTWCGPCREALPGIEMLHRGLKEKGLVVLGVDNEPAETARQYMAKQGYTFPTLVDAKEIAGKLFHVGGYPTTWNSFPAISFASTRVGNV